MRLCLWMLACVATQCVADPSPVMTAFQIQAVVTKGCVFGSSAASPVSDLGTIDFGTVASFSSAQEVVSSVGSGSIILTCTPGMSFNIGLGNGLSGVSANQRFLKHVSGTELIAYQLYQDASQTIVWGIGTQAKAIADFPLSTQTYPVFARLLSRSTWPKAGEYVDRVVVELSY